MTASRCWPSSVTEARPIVIVDGSSTDRTIRLSLTCRGQRDMTGSRMFRRPPTPFSHYRLIQRLRQTRALLVVPDRHIYREEAGRE